MSDEDLRRFGQTDPNAGLHRSSEPLPKIEGQNQHDLSDEPQRHDPQAVHADRDKTYYGAGSDYEEQVDPSPGGKRY